MRFLSNKEKKDMKDKLPFGYEVSKKDELKEGKDEIIYKNGEKYLIVLNGEYLPHLGSINEAEYKAVYVDKGAIPFVIKGADLMRPGIQRIDEGIEKDDIVMIKDENHNKTIALGISLFSSSELNNQSSGKSAKVVHYVGDKYY